MRVTPSLRSTVSTDVVLPARLGCCSPKGDRVARAFVTGVAGALLVHVQGHVPPAVLCDGGLCVSGLVRIQASLRRQSDAGAPLTACVTSPVGGSASAFGERSCCALSFSAVTRRLASLL